MKNLFLSLLFLPSTLAAHEVEALKSISARDDARIEAIISSDKAALGAILADDLHYGHSTGIVDTKSSFIERLASGKTSYKSISHLERIFTFPAKDIALMTGRARIISESSGGPPSDNTLAYLGVWKHTASGWQFLSWQSSRLPVEDSK